MGKIGKFEDLLCWQKARIIVNDIYKITCEEKFSKDFSLKDQIRRASNSVMLNIAEGFCRRTHNEFKHFLFVAFGSNGEIQSHFILLLTENIFPKKYLIRYMKSATKIQKLFPD